MTDKEKIREFVAQLRAEATQECDHATAYKMTRIISLIDTLSSLPKEPSNRDGVTIRAWAAHDDWHDYIQLFANKPEWDAEGWEYGCGDTWRDGDSEGMKISCEIFPELTKEKSPAEIDLYLLFAESKK